MGRLHSSTNLDPATPTAEYESISRVLPTGDDTRTGVPANSDIILEFGGREHPDNINYIGFPDIDKLTTTDSGTNDVFKQHTSHAVKDGYGLVYETDAALAVEGDPIANVTVAYVSGYTPEDAKLTDGGKVRIKFNPFGNTAVLLGYGDYMSMIINRALPTVWVNKGYVDEIVDGGAS